MNFVSGNYRAGQVIKATSRENGDTASFVVSDVLMGGLRSRHFDFIASEFTFEVVSEPLPSVPGVYSIGKNLMYLLLNTQGEWFYFDFTSSVPDFHKTNEADIRNRVVTRNGVTLVYEYGKEFRDV